MSTSDESIVGEIKGLARHFELVAASRRSVYTYLHDSIPPDTIAWAVNMAGLAPNHYKTRPWRFCVFAEDGRRKLADAYGAAAARIGRDVGKARDKAFSAPVMIAVSCVPQLGNPKVKVHEEEFATATAVQNLMLALAAAGVGSIWTTGELAGSEEVREAVSIAPGGRVLGVIYVGLQDPERPLPDRADVDCRDLTTWCIA